MDDISVAALDGLRAAIQSLLPVQADVNLQPVIQVHPSLVSPTGLSGFVGMHDNPVGEILGRRVEGSVVIRLQAATASDMDAVLSGAITALAGADRATLLGKGLLRLSLAKVGDRVPGNGNPAAQEITVAALYEFLKIPTDPQDTIQQIPLNIQLQQ